MCGFSSGTTTAMDLPNLFTVNVAQAGQRVCVLVLTSRSVLAGLLVVHPSGSQLLSISEQIPYTDDASVLLAADEVLQELGKESEDVNEVVFCLEQSWFDANGALLVEKQALLKNIKEELSLQPVGYVLQHETVTEHLINQQKQLSGLILFLSGESVAVTLVLHGAIVASNVVGRSGEIQSDVVEALSRIAQKTENTALPGKLLCATIALEVAELFELQQELLTVVWPETVTFLQSPVVDVIKPQLSAQIVVVGAGKALQQLESGSPAPISDESSAADVGALAGTALAASEIPGAAEAVVATDEQSVTEEYAVEPPTASSFGIPINPEPQITFAQSPVAENQPADTQPPPALAAKKPLAGWLAGLRKSSHQPTKRQLIIGAAAAILGGLLVVFLIGYLYLAVTAVLVLSIQPKTQLLSQEAELTLDPTLTATDVQNRRIRAQKLEVELSSSGETKATGIKIVGEKAKGSVIVLNKTSSAKSFPAGTLLKTDKLAYTLDESIEVPAATISAKPGGTGEEKEYGQRSAKATATVLGVDNNIDKDVVLMIGDFDSGTYAARTETAMTGGSSREVQVVSQTDLDVLAADVKKELLEKARTELEAKQASDQRIIPLDTLAVSKQVFSAKEGTEVDSVKLDLTATATGLAYNIADLEPIAEVLLSGLVPTGYSLEGHLPQILSAAAASGSSQVKVTVNLSSKVHALVETEQLRTQLQSQSLDQAKTIVGNNPAVEKASFGVSPSIAQALIKKVPNNASRFRITVDVVE